MIREHLRGCLAAAGLVAALALGPVGCGSREADFIAVAGKVTFQGTPLKAGVVVFVADASKGNTTPHEPRGIINEDGQYELTTAGKPGAPLGWYKIAVNSNKPQDPKNPYAMPVSVIPARYNKAENSGKTIEVVAKPVAGAFDIDLN